MEVINEVDEGEVNEKKGRGQAVGIQKLLKEKRDGMCNKKVEQKETKSRKRCRKSKN